MRERVVGRCEVCGGEVVVEMQWGNAVSIPRCKYCGKVVEPMQTQPAPTNTCGYDSQWNE